MLLRFADAAVARVCNSRRLLHERWGQVRGLAVERSLLLLRAAPDLDAVRTIPMCRFAPDSTEWNIEVPDAARIAFIPRQGFPADEPASLRRPSSWLLVTKVSAVIAQGSRR